MSCLSGCGCFGSGSSKPSVGTKAKRSKATQEEDRKAKLLARQQKSAEKAQHGQLNKAYQKRLKFLTKVPLFRQLPRSKDPLLASACEDVEFSVGEVILRQGEMGGDLYVICEGSAEMIAEQQDEQGNANVAQLAVLNEGDYFGERAFLNAEAHVATVKALTRLVCCKLTKQRFENLGIDDHVRFVDRRAALGGADDKQIKTEPPSQKTPEQAAFIAKALLENVNLKGFMSLSDAHVQGIVYAAWSKDVRAGEEIITAGDVQANYFYIVQEGNFEFWVDSREASEKDDDKSQLKVHGAAGPGGSFGELALLYSAPRQATVRAVTEAKVWVVDRRSVKRILMEDEMKKNMELEKIIAKVDIMSSLIQSERLEIAEALTEMHFNEKDVVIRQDEPVSASSCFYLLQEGEVVFIIDDKPVRRLVGNPKSGLVPWFGELALLGNEPRTATVEVVSKTAMILALDRSSFNFLMGPLKDVLRRHRWSAPKPVPGGRRATVANLREYSGKLQHKVVRFEDLRPVGLLGCGGFGKVELMEDQRTKAVYAAKGLSKGHLVKTRMQDRVHAEKEILMMTDSRFIIKLYGCFADEQYLYLILEVAIGGELHATYRRERFYGSLEHAKFYAASVVLAFAHLHERHVIYRDLKPENLLLDQHGQLKLTDMGLARFCIGKAFSTVGTPEYFAPELIQSVGHGVALDWWTLGILIFELLSGTSPFVSKAQVEIYKKVLRGVDEVNFPSSIGSKGKDLISDLLRQDPSRRIPMLPDGQKRLREHPWFKSFDWDALAEGKKPPPYRPSIKHVKDLSNFNARRDNIPKCIPYVGDGSDLDDDWTAM
eukprot:TRINITY_DN68822_c0_g1_i1.p1 TRINITY_DN68822_c0_g1~~TRINITY_DN68822_c0_g1_i1.p1  ORF type:complete len:828 (+),score=187.91 TRINITY_DN68822_c0_g1_i1:164-2647(+)